jgi:chloramphenicol-sensitive protein RarD
MFRVVMHFSGSSARSRGVIHSTREGFLYGLAAYGWWGLVPIYFHWLGEISALEILAQRIVWSAVFLAAILTLACRWPETVRCLRSGALLKPLIVSALLVACNWLMYIYAVESKNIVQASLGYFILPLINTVLGVVLFRERLRPLQQVALGFGALGVILLTWHGGVFPWLALTLAVSFSLYGMIRRQVPVDGLIGLTVETIVLLPIAGGYLLVCYVYETGCADPGTLGKLSLSGIVTAVPLLCFGQAARRLPFSTLGFMQYISPSLQLLLALFLFSEPMPGGWFSFPLIWAALGLFSIDSYCAYRRQARMAGEGI